MFLGIWVISGILAMVGGGLLLFDLNPGIIIARSAVTCQYIVLFACWMGVILYPSNHPNFELLLKYLGIDTILLSIGALGGSFRGSYSD